MQNEKKIIIKYYSNNFKSTEKIKPKRLEQFYIWNINVILIRDHKVTKWSI